MYTINAGNHKQNLSYDFISSKTKAKRHLFFCFCSISSKRKERSQNTCLPLSQASELLKILSGGEEL